MKKSKVGTLISKGKTIEEIRMRIKDFPSNPTIEYFISLGYKDSTAKTYKSKLKKNETLKQQQKITMEEQNKISEKEDEENLIKSKNADENNLILDTCALESKQCVSIIEASKNVNVLLVTIDEFDNIIQRYKYGEKFDENFICNIRKFSRKILEDNKYVLTPFECTETKYVDKMIIKYILSLPIERRPTLITADIRLAARAKCCGIEYIIYMTPLEEQIKKKKQRKITDFGVCIEIYENKLIMEKSINDIKCFYVKDNQCLELKQLEEVDTGRNYTLNLLKKNTKSNKIKVLKVEIKKQKMTRKRIDFNSIDEVNGESNQIHPMVIEEMRKFF